MGYLAVAEACKRDVLEQMEQEDGEMWAGRLNAFLDAMRELPPKEDFDGLDAITILDVERLSEVAQSSSKMKHYLSTLPGYVEPGKPCSAVTHSQHLKVVYRCAPMLAAFA